jgi:hypothetical protein
MSLDLIERETRRFLASSAPEIICISGGWGVGKSYAWNRILRKAQANNAIALKRYAYVSLFGLNSLEQFRNAIFENSLDTSQIEVDASFENVRSNIASMLGGSAYGTGSNRTGIFKRFWRKAVSGVSENPFLGQYIGSFSSLLFSLVSSTLICIDDIERRGAGLSMREVLGLASNLKELKKCKIALILNEEALGQDKADFNKYFEKVIDVSFNFAPSPEESARIAFQSNDDIDQQLSRFCVQLGISNIRLLKKIERAVRLVAPVLQKHDKKVLGQAIQSLSLFGWCIFEPAKAPSLEFLIRKRSSGLFGLDKGKLSDKEAAWNAMLDAYQFTSLDDLDNVLLKGIQDGYFDTDEIDSSASKMDDQISADSISQSFSQAWDAYHDSFSTDENAVLDPIYKAFFKGIEHISPVNLDGTVRLFKGAGREKGASEMIGAYVKKHAEEKPLFDLKNYPFRDLITDPDVIEAFKKRLATFKDARDPVVVLLSIGRTQSWNPQDLTMLSALSVDDYYRIFKSITGDDLRHVVKACLIDNGSPEMKSIGENAKEALRRIGKESPINAMRVKRYGL